MRHRSPRRFQYAIRNGQILYALGSSNSVTSYPRNPALGQGINPVTGAPNSGSVEIYGAPQDLPNPYVYTYSLEVQQELPAKLTATIGYQGSAGHKLIRLVNQNFLYPNNPAFFAVYFTTPDVNSNYNALNANLVRRFSGGFQLQANYRFSKSIDQLSYEGPGFVTNQTYPQDNRTERGPSDFDVRHYFNLSGLYELPFFRKRNDLVGKLLGGFEVTGIVTARTGFPFTPRGRRLHQHARWSRNYVPCVRRDIADQANSTPRTMPSLREAISPVAERRSSLSSNSRRIRSPLRASVAIRSEAQAISTLIMSLVKQTRLPGFLGETANLELRANFFNVFNIRNLKPFEFGSHAVTIGDFDSGGNMGAGSVISNVNFSKATEGLAGRVVELQARFRF